MNKKECNQCKELKPYSDFQKDAHKKDGYRARCKACVNPAERERSYLKPRKRTKEDKLVRAEYARSDYEKNREKYIARDKLRVAVKTGKIVKPDHCQQVNLNIPDCTGRLQAHHYLGYKGVHWGDVMWLCTKHHGMMHRKKEVLPLPSPSDWEEQFKDKYVSVEEPYGLVGFSMWSTLKKDIELMRESLKHFFLEMLKDEDETINGMVNVAYKARNMLRQELREKIEKL